jgi:hypothetical protein
VALQEVAWSEDQAILVVRWSSTKGADVSPDALVAIAHHVWQN